MNAQEWKTLAKAMLVCMVAVALLLGLSLWLLIYVNRDLQTHMTFEQVLNLILVSLVALMFPVIQYGQARWLWHTRHVPSGQQPAWMSEKTAHLPKVAKPWQQRLLEVGMQIGAMLLLLWLFGTYANQQYLVGIANAHNISSELYLVGVMVAGVLPIALLAGLVKWLRDAVARDWDKQGLRYQLWKIWLWAYVMAFGFCVYIILMLGLMLVRYLE